MAVITRKKCQRPACSAPPTETYHGPNGNVLRLCESCYYRMVKDGGSCGPVGITPTDKPGGGLIDL